MPKTLQVKVVENSNLNSSSLVISNELAHKLRLENKDKISLSVGKLAVSLTTIASNRPQDYLELNSQVLRKLHLIASKKYGINKTNGSLQLGPVVGIMTEYTHDMKRPFSNQSSFIKEMIIAGNKLGELCYGFDPRRINFRTKTVVGYTVENNTWKKGIFPVPDVVYPRESGPWTSKLRIRPKLKALGCKIINPPLIGKWKSYQILSANPSLQEYLPDTRRLSSFAQLKTMLGKYGTVYLKPVSGSQGRNIIKISQQRNPSLYKYQYTIKGHSRSERANNFDNLCRNLKKIMTNRNYLVQNRIRLLRINGAIADLRVLVQKDDSGTWSVTGKVFRIGKPGSITTNISGGGSAEKPETVLRKICADSEDEDRILKQIDYLALEVAHALENATSSIGELGVDIGIDVNGRLWFIEANLKPARRLFLMVGDKSTRHISVQRPLLYARYLSGFEPGSRGN